MNFELCTSSVEGAKIASEYDFKRIELCSALSAGGLTPSIGLVEKCSEYNVEVHCMVRHREGNFNYSKDEIEILSKDIHLLSNAEVKGVVFGVLTSDFRISESNKVLIGIAKKLGLEVTFHRAFDFVQNPYESIEQLIKYGFNRVLTSGLESTAIEGIELITNLQNRYGSEIQIMVGSGINSSNVIELSNTGVKNIHFTAHKAVLCQEGMGDDLVVDEQKIKSIVSLF